MASGQQSPGHSYSHLKPGGLRRIPYTWRGVGQIEVCGCKKWSQNFLQILAGHHACQNPAQQGRRLLFHWFSSVLGILARLWLWTEAAGRFSSCSASPQAVDGLEPQSSVMRNNSLNPGLINISHFNNTFGIGGSCQQKLWSLVPHPPTGHENKALLPSPSSQSCMEGEDLSFWTLMAKWSPEDHQSQLQGVKAAS